MPLRNIPVAPYTKAFPWGVSKSAVPFSRPHAADREWFCLVDESWDGCYSHCYGLANGLTFAGFSWFATDLSMALSSQSKELGLLRHLLCLLLLLEFDHPRGIRCRTPALDSGRYLSILHARLY